MRSSRFHSNIVSHISKTTTYKHFVTMFSPSYMTKETLAELLGAPSTGSVAVIDVRDEDHVGGHIKGSQHVPSASLDYRMPELVRTLKGKEKVVFHCALSQQRGPSAARAYCREREKLGDESRKQEVFILEGGFTQWQRKYAGGSVLLG